MMPSGHPDRPELLLWQTRELSPEKMAEVDRHLESCGACRDKLAQVESLYQGIAEIDDAAGGYRVPPVARPGKQGVWRRVPRPPRWITATAGALIAVLVVTSITDLIPTARADMLLSMAAKEQEAEIRAPRFIRVQGSAMQCGGAAGAYANLTPGSESEFCANLLRDLSSVGWGWDDMLSAKSFLRWRRSLGKKKDSVERVADATDVTTSTPDGPLRRATLRLRSSDHHPTGGRFVFAGEQRVIEVSEIVEAPQLPAHDSALSHLSLRAVPAHLPAAADPLEVREAEVRLALHRIGVDENILLAVRRDGSTVAVSGVAPDRESEARIADVLHALPDVSVAVVAEGDPPSANAVPAWQPFRGDTTPLANDLLNVLFQADPDGRSKFVNRLDTTTRRLVGETRARDALLDLATRLRGTEPSAQVAAAAAEIQRHIAAEESALASQLEPLTGAIEIGQKALDYDQATQVYTDVHEVVLLNRSGNPLTLDESLNRIRRLLSGR